MNFPRNSFSSSQIFMKSQKVVYIYTLSCILDLCTTWTKSVILSSDMMKIANLNCQISKNNSFQNSTKFLKIMCLIYIHSLICQYSRYACRLWKVFWLKYVFGNFQELYYMFKTLHLHQTLTNCVYTQSFHSNLLYVIVFYERQKFRDEK